VAGWRNFPLISFWLSTFTELCGYKAPKDNTRAIGKTTVKFSRPFLVKQAYERMEPFSTRRVSAGRENLTVVFPIARVLALGALYLQSSVNVLSQDEMRGFSQ
jgi:hypothetical protein